MRALDYSRLLLLSLSSMIQKPISDPPQNPWQPTQRLSALSCPLPGIWYQLCHGTSGFHCLTSAYVAPFKCGYWKAFPTGKAPALYNSFHPADKHLCWVFDYIGLYVSRSYCLRSSFFHSMAQKDFQETADNTKRKESEIYADSTPQAFWGQQPSGGIPTIANSSERLGGY